MVTTKRFIPKGASRPIKHAPLGGLIAVGGLPFAGRTVLAAMIADRLPASIKLETVERLSRQIFYPMGQHQPAAARPDSALLEAAARHLRVTRPTPTIVLSARFETPAARQRVLACAQAEGARFLYIEARSANVRAIAHVYRFLGLGDPRKQLALYDTACARYKPVSREEALDLPSVCLSAVLKDPDAACSKALKAWRTQAG